MPRLRRERADGCDLGPVDVCLNCYDAHYSGQIVVKGDSYATGRFSCVDCGAVLTTEDDPYYRPPRQPYLGKYTTAIFLLMEIVALVGSVYAWVVIGPLWGFVVGIGVSGFALGWLHRQISRYLNYEPPELVRIRIQRRPDKVIADDVFSDPAQDITGYTGELL